MRVQLYLEGKGRNEIAQTLNLSRIRISQGSVTNILRTYKAGEKSTKTDFPRASEPALSSPQLETSPTSEMETQIPVSEGAGQEVPPVSSTPVPKVLIAPVTSTPAATTSSTSIPTSYLSVQEASPYLGGVNSYPHLYSHFNLGQISHVNMGLVSRINLACLQDSAEKETIHEVAQEVQDSSPGPGAPEVTSSEVHSKEAPSSEGTEPGEEEEAQAQIPIPVPAVPWSGVFQEIEDAKRQRRDELLLIDRRSAHLEEQKRRVDYEWWQSNQANKHH